VDTESAAYSILYKMGIKDPQGKMQLAWKTYKNRIGKNVNQIAKTFFTIVQLDLDAVAEKDDYGKVKLHRVRSAKEQTDLLRKAGYDAIIDTSRNSQQAIINEREPEQICFITRNSFEVIDVYALRKGDPKLLTLINPGDIGVSRKLAAEIAKHIDDSLTSEEGEHGRLFWTKKGRRIKVEWLIPQSYMDSRRLGEKKHKEAKTSEHHYPAIELHSEKEAIKTQGYSSDKFSEIASRVATSWRRAAPLENWVPENKASYEKGVEDANTAATRKRIAEEHQEDLEEVSDNNRYLLEIAAMLRLPYHPFTDAEEGATFYHSLVSLAYHIRQESTKDQAMTPEQFQTAWEGFMSSEAFKTKVAPGRKQPNQRALSEVKDIFSKIYTTYADMPSPLGGGLFSRQYIALERIKHALKEKLNV
jgi:hypothetical protein